MVDEAELSADEKWAVGALRRLAKRWPETLWLFAGSGALCVMRKSADGAHVVLPSGGVDPGAIVATVEIECDGGDF